MGCTKKKWDSCFFVGQVHHEASVPGAELSAHPFHSPQRPQGVQPPHDWQGLCQNCRFRSGQVRLIFLKLKLISNWLKYYWNVAKSCNGRGRGGGGLTVTGCAPSHCFLQWTRKNLLGFYGNMLKSSGIGNRDRIGNLFPLGRICVVFVFEEPTGPGSPLLKQTKIAN